MTGTELLREVRKLHPDARKVLLTAYADTEAAIRGINDVGLDHYLMKPWDPPALRLYPVLDDLLSDWHATVRPPYEGIRVAGAPLVAAELRGQGVPVPQRVPYQWVDVDQDAPSRELVGDVHTRLPVVLFPDGTTLVPPTNRELAEKIGMQTRASLPSTTSSSLAAARPGWPRRSTAPRRGCARSWSNRTRPADRPAPARRIENYLGFPSGRERRRSRAPGHRSGAPLRRGNPQREEAVALRREDPYRLVRLADGTEVCCYASYLAQGVAVRTLDVPARAAAPASASTTARR